MSVFTKWLAIGAVLAVALAGCARPSSQNVYSYKDIGKGTAISFGTVLSSRPIDIVGKNTGVGALAGGAAGAGAGSYIGSGSGMAWAVGIGALAGALAGAAAEQAMADRQGVEYTVILESGVALTIAQEIGKGESLIPNGTRVIVQNTGGYQRVLAADNLPTTVARPQGIKVVDPAPPAAAQ